MKMEFIFDEDVFDKLKVVQKIGWFQLKNGPLFK